MEKIEVADLPVDHPDPERIKSDAVRQRREGENMFTFIKHL